MYKKGINKTNIIAIVLIFISITLNSCSPAPKYEIYMKLKTDFTGLEAKKGKELTESKKKELIEGSFNTLKNRLDKLGASKISVTETEPGTIIIKAKTLQPLKRIRDVIILRGIAEFRLVDKKYTERALKWQKKNYEKKKFPGSKEEQEKLLQKISHVINLPKDLELLFFFNKDNPKKILSPSELIVLNRKVELENGNIQSAMASNDHDIGQIVVNFQTTKEGKINFARVTASENKGKRLAFVLDNKVLFAPNIRDQILHGNGQITGDYTFDEASRYANLLRNSSIPYSLIILEEKETHLQ
ncbi:MAG: hypothetical protein GY754_24620 [bacterium]|nr:hypothetical protein [bacterium]